MDFDFRKRFRLDADQLFEPDQFQQREKRADNFGTVRGAFKQFGEAHAAAFGDGFKNKFDLFADGPFILENVARIALAFFEALQDAVDGVEQIENGDIGFDGGRGGFKFQFAR